MTSMMVGPRFGMALTQRQKETVSELTDLHKLRDEERRELERNTVTPAQLERRLGRPDGMNTHHQAQQFLKTAGTDSRQTFGYYRAMKSDLAQALASGDLKKLGVSGMYILSEFRSGLLAEPETRERIAGDRQASQQLVDLLESSMDAMRYVLQEDPARTPYWLSGMQLIFNRAKLGQPLCETPAFPSAQETKYLEKILIPYGDTSKVLEVLVSEIRAERSDSALAQQAMQRLEKDALAKDFSGAGHAAFALLKQLRKSDVKVPDAFFDTLLAQAALMFPPCTEERDKGANNYKSVVDWGKQKGFDSPDWNYHNATKDEGAFFADPEQEKRFRLTVIPNISEPQTLLNIIEQWGQPSDPDSAVAKAALKQLKKLPVMTPNLALIFLNQYNEETTNKRDKASVKPPRALFNYLVKRAAAAE